MSPFDDKAFLIYKPLGWSSFDVVKKMKNLLGVKKIGHAGTLDPLAEGLLILCSGKKTKTIALYQGLPKIYEGRIGLGKTTATLDRGSPFENPTPYAHLQADQIKEAAASFVGKIEQVPPIYSALKVNGKRAYSLARAGEVPILKAREVEVEAFDLVEISLPWVDFHIKCSKGTYIRSLAADLGKKLGVGGYLERLIRVAIGPYHIQNAVTPQAVAEDIELLTPAIIA